MTARPLTLQRLVRRQLATDVGAVLALAGTTVVVTALLTALPRGAAHVIGEDRAEHVAALGTAVRDLTPERPGEVYGDVLASAAGVTDVLTGAAADGEQVAARLGPELRSVLGTPGHALESMAVEVELDPDVDRWAGTTVAGRVVPGIEDEIRLVEGRAPQASAPVGLEDPADVEVLLSVVTAAALGWEVGEARASTGSTVPVTLHLVGTFTPVDATSPVWTHAGPLLEPGRSGSENAGWTAEAAGLVHPGGLGPLTRFSWAALQRWFPVDGAAVVHADPVALVADLEQARATLGLRSETRAAVGAAQERATAMTAVLDVVAAGALGTGLAVLWLGSVLVAQRRGPALELLRARGATAATVAGTVAAQTLVATVPSAAVGAVAGLLAVPGPVRARDLAVPVALGVLPAALAGVAAWRRSARSPGRAAGRPAWRWVLEALSVAAAGAAVAAVVTGGGAGDPALTALPVLLGLAAAAVGLRVHPLLLAPATRPVRRRRRLGPFLTLAQLARAGSGAAVPVLVLVVAAGTLGLATSVMSGVDAGTRERAARAVGADVRLEALLSTAAAAPLTADDLTALAEVTGVRAVAAVRDAGRARLRAPGTDGVVSVLAVDADALAAVQATLPAAVRSPLGTLTPEADGPAGVLLPVTSDVVPGAEVELGRGADAAPAGGPAVLGEAPGVAVGTAWAVVDAATWRERSGDPDGPVRTVLVGLDAGAEPRAVAEAATAALGGRVSADLLADRLAEHRGAAATAGLRTGLAAGGGVTVVLAALALGLALLTGAPLRARTAGVLAGLGAPRALRHRLVVGESLGLVAAALPAAAVVTVAVPLLVLRTVDLRVFTGGRAPVPTTVDPVLAAGLAVLGLVLGGAAVLVAVLSARRTAGAAPLREGGA